MAYNISEQTEEQFNLLYGEPTTQSQTAKACFDILFNKTWRGVAAKEHGITEQSICRFIKNNEAKHYRMYVDFQNYINAGKTKD